jgi:hypothetical protein
MKKTQTSVHVQKVKGVVAPPADMSESFRRARSSISDITAVKGAQRPAKPK